MEEKTYGQRLKKQEITGTYLVRFRDALFNSVGTTRCN